MQTNRASHADQKTCHHPYVYWAIVSPSKGKEDGQSLDMNYIWVVEKVCSCKSLLKTTTEFEVKVCFSSAKVGQHILIFHRCYRGVVN